MQAVISVVFPSGLHRPGVPNGSTIFTYFRVVLFCGVDRSGVVSASSGFGALARFSTFATFSVLTIFSVLALGAASWSGERAALVVATGVRLVSVEEPQAPNATVAAMAKVRVATVVRTERLVKVMRAMTSLLLCW
jgi:hypothetical protein